MSSQGYWKNNWDKRDRKSRRYDKELHNAMRGWGHTFIRPATNREDKKLKFDYVWKSGHTSNILYVDYKVAQGVQDSHRKLYEEGNLRTTHYLRLFAGRISFRSAKWFWEHPNLMRNVNRGGQVYWIVPEHCY